MNRQRGPFSRRGASGAIILLSGTFLTWSAGVMVSAQNAGGAKSVWEGVYTAAQATRGRKLYAETCQDCHMENLQGDSSDIPTLVGDPFLDSWMGKSVEDLFARMRATMPQDSPASLPAQTYVDILAYILQANKFPAGKVELKRDENLMKAMMISKTK